MLQSLFGSKSSEKVLSFLLLHEHGYASQIARATCMGLYAVQQQLRKFEEAGVLASRTVGRRRVYAYNPRYPLLVPLKRLVREAMALEPPRFAAEARTRLPESMREFFWDYPFEALSWEQDQELIIRRLLASGSWSAITWLRHRIGDEALRQWLIERRGRGLSARQLRFWSLILNLRRTRVNAWIRSTKAPVRRPE